MAKTLLGAFSMPKETAQDRQVWTKKTETMQAEMNMQQCKTTHANGHGASELNVIVFV